MRELSIHKANHFFHILNNDINDHYRSHTGWNGEVCIVHECLMYDLNRCQNCVACVCVFVLMCFVAQYISHKHSNACVLLTDDWVGLDII